MKPTHVENRMSSREKILLCASEMFYHGGYQTTSVDDIIRQCRVAKSNFYYHFRTKDDLAFAVIELQVAEYEMMADSTLRNAALPPTERMSGFFAGLEKAQAGRNRMSGCPLVNFAAALPDTEDERTERFRQRLLAFFQDLKGMLEACLVDGMRSGDFRNDLPPDATASLLLASLQGLLTLTKTHKETYILEQGTSLIHRLLKVT